MDQYLIVISGMVLATLLVSMAALYFAQRAYAATQHALHGLEVLQAPEPPNRFPVYLLGDEVTMLEAQGLRNLAVDLIQTAGHEIVLIDKHDSDETIDAPDEMRWRAEVWNAARETLLYFKAANGEEIVDQPGIHGQPLWLCDGPTRGSVLMRAAEWSVEHG